MGVAQKYSAIKFIALIQGKNIEDINDIYFGWVTYLENREDKKFIISFFEKFLLLILLLREGFGLNSLIMFLMFYEPCLHLCGVAP